MTATRLDPFTTRVLAPNPSPMTLEGTNTYLIGEVGAGSVVVVDPGPDLVDHRAAVDTAIAELDAEVAAVVLTHHHVDHAEASGWAASWGAELLAFSPGLVPAHAATVQDGDVIARAGVRLEAVHTPGHASDHLCLRLLETDALLTGDHILGRGSTVVAWPDGDMGAYLDSLERLSRLPAAVLYPGHGPSVEDPAAKISEYVAHRMEREAEVLAAIAAGDETAAQIVARVYADVDPVLHPAAQRSVLAHLDLLVSRGRVRAEGEGEQARFRA